MNKIKKGFTLVEILITTFIIAILSTISYMSIKLIGEGDIKNKKSDANVFFNDLKSNIIKNEYKELYLFLSDNNLKNNYILSYGFKNNCDNVSNIDDIFFKNYIVENNKAYFSGNILSGSINLNQILTKNSLKKIDTIDSIKTHDIYLGTDYLYNIYGSGKIYIDGVETGSILNCGDIKIMFFDESEKNKYLINNINIESNDIQRNEKNIILKYTNLNFKPELYIDSTSNQRQFFDKIFFHIKDTIENLDVEIEI